MDEFSVTVKGRLAFPFLFEARKGDEGQKDKFECKVLLPESYRKPLEALVAKALAAEFGTSVAKGDFHPIHEENGEKALPDFPISIRPWSLYAPAVVDENVHPVLDPKKVYPGCWVNVAVRAVAYNNTKKRKKGVLFSLEAVQFAGHDKPFASKKDASKLFAPVEVTERPVEDDDYSLE